MSTATPTIPELMTTQAVADLFKVKVDTVRVWIKAGDIKGIKINGYWRVERQSVIDMANRKFGS